MVAVENSDRRRFLRRLTGWFGFLGIAFTAWPFFSAWWPSRRAIAAGAPVTVDISELPPGQMMTVAWRGRPVWIVHRDKQALEKLNNHSDKLRDPKSLASSQPSFAENNFRSIKPAYLVLIGICTHLGCAPNYRPEPGSLSDDWPGGFYCPCHGSSFDLSGRVYSGVPAPINLEVPPYRFVDDKTIEIGVADKVVQV